MGTLSPVELLDINMTPARTETPMFVGMAPELRSKIYEYLFHGKKVSLHLRSLPGYAGHYGIPRKFPRFASILLVSRLAYSEAIAHYHAQVLLVCQDGPRALGVIDSYGGPRYKNFQSVKLECWPFHFTMTDFKTDDAASFGNLKSISFGTGPSSSSDGLYGIDFTKLVDGRAGQYHEGTQEVITRAQVQTWMPTMGIAMESMKGRSDTGKIKPEELSVSKHFSIAVNQLRGESVVGRVDDDWMELRLTLFGSGNWVLEYELDGRAYAVTQEVRSRN